MEMIDSKYYPIVIRKMTVMDIPFFNAVRNKCVEKLHDNTTYTVAESEKWFLSTKPSYYILSYMGTNVGYFRTSEMTKFSMYIGLDIDPEYRGLGLATVAYKMFMEYMYTTKDIVVFKLKVLSSNTNAHELYKSLGFTEVGRTALPSRKCDDIEMRLLYDIEDSVLDQFKFIKLNLTPTEFESYRDKRIVITGANGFIGRWLAMTFTYFNQRYGLDVDIQLCDIHDRVEYSTLGRYTKLDIVNRDVLGEYLTFVAPDIILNCAGIANPSTYMKMPVETLDVSYIGTKNILDWALYNTVESIICFSSSEIYGTPPSDDIPTPESYIGQIDTIGNRSCYDVGKMVLETLCYVYNLKYRLPMTVVRPFNLYGAFMDDDRVIPKYLRSVVDGKDALDVYGDGKQTRTFCYIADAIIMLLKLVNKRRGTDLDLEVYNVGTMYPEVTMPELVEQISNAVGRTITPKLSLYPDTYPSNEPMRRCPNTSKLNTFVGYLPKISLEAGLRMTYSYLNTKYDTTI